MIRVIKYTELTGKTRSPQDIALADDRAMAEFRGFHQLADVHVKRVNDPRTLDVLDEVIDHVKNALRSRRKMIAS